MGNERNTENLVRNDLRLKGYYDDPNVIVEEQKSSSPKINKLLAHASKSGAGVGRPEFIIRFKNRPGELVVIECKASTLKHESRSRGNSKDYAVDGVLLYAEYLKQGYNVTAIAVSGEDEREKRISTFLWLKNAYRYLDIQDKVFLTPEEITSITDRQNTPVSEEYLVKKAIEYNDLLHRYSIPEVERCTFISSILVALQDEVFITSYKLYEDNVELLESLYEACNRVLKKNELSIEKREVILSEYRKFQHNQIITSSFIKRRGGTECRNKVLFELIDDFNRDILPAIKGHHFDVLGKFYTQFIRYAGADAKTGLVLTPSHITNFFCEVADLKSDDIVFDPCCGTGGFLVSAMKYMLNKAGNSQEIQKRIKSKQLIGIEQRNDMFSHVCSNMMMRGDGKSHIYLGDCFNESLKDKVKNEKPSVTFLNPPYQDGNAAEQLEFIENALDCIVKNGICVAICQMSTAVSSHNRVTEIKRRLIAGHTLKAVFSMPDDLFYPVGVNTCILVFEAKSPHPENKETFFGYFKNDGFVKRKNKGRVDAVNKWCAIKKRWLDAYVNNKNIDGLSITQKVGAEDEWCAEAYIKTDYNEINNNYFIQRLKAYAVHLFVSGRKDEIINTSISTEEIKLNQFEWKWFELNQYLSMDTGRYYPKESFDTGGVPLVTSKEDNNGVCAYTDLCPSFTTNGITIGKVSCSAFYQQAPFNISTDVTVLYNKNIITPSVGMFLAGIINLEKPKWNYGRQIRLNDSRKLQVKLPADTSGHPDWEFMSRFIKSLPYSSNLISL